MILRGFGSAFSFGFFPAVKSGRLFWLASLRGVLQKRLEEDCMGKPDRKCVSGHKQRCCQGTFTLFCHLLQLVRIYLRAER